MESQRIKLLTEGYLCGWLTFKYPNQTSKLREEYILGCIFDRQLSDILDKKLLLESACIPLDGAGRKDTIAGLMKSYKLYGRLKLPSLFIEDKIEEVKASSTDLKEWKEFLDNLKNKK